MIMDLQIGAKPGGSGKQHAMAELKIKIPANEKKGREKGDGEWQREGRERQRGDADGERMEKGSASTYGPISRRLNSVATPITLEKFIDLHSKKGHKLKRDINQINNTISSKQKTLEALKKELQRIQEINEKSLKLQRASEKYDSEIRQEENLESMITTSRNGRDVPPLQSKNIRNQKTSSLNSSRRPASAIGSEQIGNAKPQSIRFQRQRSQMTRKVAQNQDIEIDEPILFGQPPRLLQLTQSQMFKSSNSRPICDTDDLSFDADLLSSNVKTDHCKADFDGKSNQLLEKKVNLITRIKKCRIKYLKEVYQGDQYKHMLERIGADHQEKKAQIHQLDPYFNFQDKIKETLTDIDTSKDERQKAYDRRIGKIRSQIQEKSAIMQQELRAKCRELAVLQRYNKKRSKQRKSMDRDFVSESQSVSGSTSYCRSRAAKDCSMYDDKQSQFTQFTQRKAANVQSKDDQLSQQFLDQKDQNKNEIDIQQTSKGQEINLDNVNRLYELIQSCTMIKQFYKSYKNRGAMAPGRRIAMNDLEMNTNAKGKEFSPSQMNQQRKDLQDQVMRISAIINAKPQKAGKVTFHKDGVGHDDQAKQAGSRTDNKDKSSINIQSEKQILQAQKEEAWNQAHCIFQNVKQNLESLLLQPSWHNPLQPSRPDKHAAETDLMIHELNVDIQMKQENALLQKDSSSLFDQMLVKSFENGSASDIWDNHAHLGLTGGLQPTLESESRLQAFKRINSSLIQEIRLNIDGIRNRERSPLKDQNSADEAQELKLLNEELLDRLKIQESIENEEEKIRDYKILAEMMQQPDQIIKIYNETMAKDGIMSMEHVELNENKVEKMQEKEKLKKELQKFGESERVNAELRIDHMSYMERRESKIDLNKITDEVEYQKYQERMLLRKALSKYGQSEGIMSLVQRNEETADDHSKRQAWIAKAIYIHDKAKDAETRAKQLSLVQASGEKEMQLDQYLLKQELIKDYNIEQMFSSHREFSVLTTAVKQIHDRIRLQCKQSTSTFAYRLYCILDIAQIKCPNDELKTIIKRHKKFWPYKSLNIGKADDLQLGKQESQDEAALKNILGEYHKKRLTQAQKRKMEAVKMQIQQLKQNETELPPEHDNKEIIANVFKQLIETKLNFIHQKFMLKFLSCQVYELRLDLRNEDGDSEKDSLKLPEPSTLKECEREYQVVMDLNQQNYRNDTIKQNIQECGLDDSKALNDQEEQMLQQNLAQIEERYHRESRENHLEEDKKRQVQMFDAINISKSQYDNLTDRLIQRQKADTDITNQVNSDKKSYGKLMNHTLRNKNFVRSFEIEARKYQKSELLKIPELDAEQHDPQKALECLTKQTMCHQQKRIDNKEEVRSRQEIIRERHIQKVRPTLRFDLSSTTGRDQMQGTSNLLFKRTNSMNIRKSFSQNSLRESDRKRSADKNTQLKSNRKQKENQQKADKFRIRKIQGKKNQDASVRSFYGKIEQVLSTKYDEFKKTKKSRRVANNNEGRILNADIFPLPTSGSILKRRSGSTQMPDLNQQAQNKVNIPNLNLRKEQYQMVNEAELAKGNIASAKKSSGRQMATITDGEEETIASKQKPCEQQLLVQPKGHASKEWYLAASDEEYSVPGDHDQKTVTNTFSTSNHQPLHALQSTRVPAANFEQTQSNVFFTDRNRPTSATSMNQLKFNRPLKLQMLEPAYQTSANFFDQEHDAQTMKSCQSGSSLLFGIHAKKNSEVQESSKIKIKKIKLPKLKKNKELNNMIKDL